MITIDTCLNVQSQNTFKKIQHKFFTTKPSLALLGMKPFFLPRDHDYFDSFLENIGATSSSFTNSPVIDFRPRRYRYTIITILSMKIKQIIHSQNQILFTDCLIHNVSIHGTVEMILIYCHLGFDYMFLLKY